MPDLRRQIFESGKTVSRKAASREASRTNSPAGSKQTSRNASRAPSDEEDSGFLSDETSMSIGSLDDENPEQDNPDWEQELGERIQEILDRKRSSVQGREEALQAFCRLTKYHYTVEEIHGAIPDLLAAFERSVRTEISVREATLGLRAIELLVISAFDNTVYENTEPLLTRTIRDSASPLIKTAAIHCLGACTIFGGAGEDGILEQMGFLLDIIASDGQSIDATDDPTIVTAALQQWGFLATEVDDFEEESEEAVQIFMDQLDSSDSNVQIAAGENIALLYEKSYSPQEDDDEEEESADSNDGSDEHEHDNDPTSGPKLVKRYNAYHNTPELESQLKNLATIHGKQISKRDKKSLHSNFASILTTVENPRRGPRYNTAIDQNTNRHYGSTLTVKIGRHGVMTIDRWWKWVRLTALRRILQGGFSEHYFQGNRSVLNSLPVMMRMANQGHGSVDRQGARKAAKMRNSRRWTTHQSDDEEE
ncbi:Interferon-related developmental regulator N-terminal [Penicillium samsonianum]|uniref:Interferon-related developmental regulator N-terminal n=1 Tax=Penicillium samsonianum TaxID=1882272 RepID=UPI002548D0F4|nr:Interferon-related developmental regulator N-terminal [Penicillium samsonianum]KAJ6132815.1 Interferon-related developmental regulator N-terminal [Penicillium samsonianum]